MYRIGDELYADDGYKLTNGYGYWSSVYLGCNDDEASYIEILESDVPPLLIDNYYYQQND